MTDKKPLLNNQAYDIARDAAQLYIPAFGTFYFTIAGVWGLPYAEQVVSTAVALATLLGVLLKVSQVQYKRSDIRFDGALNVDKTDPEKDTYDFAVDNLHTLSDKSEITLKVNKVSQ